MTRRRLPEHSNVPLLILSWQYPAFSETFVRDHATNMVHSGFDVRLLAHVHGDQPNDAAAQLSSGIDYWPQFASRTELWIKIYHLARESLPRALSCLGGVLKAALRGKVRNPLKLLLYRMYLARTVPEQPILHAHFGRQGVLAAELCEAGLNPVVFITTLHGYDINRPLHAGERPYDLLWQRAGRILVGTEFMRQRAMALGCPEQKLECLPVGVAVDCWPFRERSAPVGRPIRLLSVSRLVPYKGTEVAIRAIALLRDQGFALNYRVGGTGSSEADLRALVEETALTSSVEFLGALNAEQVREQMLGADIFVYPSRTVNGDMEGQGLAIQEAQATGLLVVGTRHGGIPEGILDGETGVLAREDDPEDLADKIKWLIGEQFRWAEMSRMGRKFVEQRFNQKTLFARTREIYSEIRQFEE